MVLNFQTRADNIHQATLKNIGFVNIGKDIDAKKKCFLQMLPTKDLNHASESLDSSPTWQKGFQSQSHLILGVFYQWTSSNKIYQYYHQLVFICKLLEHTSVFKI